MRSIRAPTPHVPLGVRRMPLQGDVDLLEALVAAVELDLSVCSADGQTALEIAMAQKDAYPVMAA